MGEALQTFLQDTSEIKCDEIAKTFSKKGIREKRDENTPYRIKARKTRRFSSGKGSDFSRDKSQALYHIREPSSSVTKTSGTNEAEGTSQNPSMGEEEALNKPPTGQ